MSFWRRIVAWFSGPRSGPRRLTLLSVLDQPFYARELNEGETRAIRREATLFRLSGLSSLAEWSELPAEDRLELAVVGWKLHASAWAPTVRLEILEAMDGGAARRGASLDALMQAMSEEGRHGT